MKSLKNGLLAALTLSAFTLSGAHAASWQDSLNSAASQLSGSSTQASGGGMSISSLTSLLNGSSQSLTASSMNNAAGILSYCAKQKLASVTSADNVKNQVLDKLGLSTPEKQKQDTSYLDGLQGLLNSKNGQQLDLNTLGNSSLAKQVKTKACDLVLKQGVNFLSWYVRLMPRLSPSRRQRGLKRLFSPFSPCASPPRRLRRRSKKATSKPILNNCTLS